MTPAALGRRAALALLPLLAACDEVRSPSEVVDGPAFAAVGRQVLMLDQCDPTSFNAAIGAGTCINRNGGLRFETFIKLLEKHQQVASWRFSPGVIHVSKEVTLPIVNVGGEVHTFTEVAQFGGGIVPDLNVLSGTPVPAPECLTLTGADFIPSGGQTTHTFSPGDADRYQCCIHPWMRAESR